MKVRITFDIDYELRVGIARQFDSETFRIKPATHAEVRNWVENVVQGEAEVIRVYSQ